MVTPVTALGGLWVAWLLSWLLASRWTNVTRIRQSGLDELKHGVVVWVGAALLFGRPGVAGPLLHPFYQRGPAMAWTGVGITLCGFLWAWWARLHLGRQWSASVTLKEGHSLIRSGPYRLTRHPIYSGLLLAALGSAVVQDTWAAVIGFVLVTLGLWVKSRQEERLMASAFGVEYAAYRAEVPALVPRPW